MRLSLTLCRIPASIPVPAAIDQPDNDSINSRPSIVIADDDVTVRTLVRSALENEGMQCQLASNGPDALQLVHDHQPDAAVLDTNMPGMDGFEVLAAVRAEVPPVASFCLPHVNTKTTSCAVSHWELTITLSNRSNPWNCRAREKTSRLLNIVSPGGALVDH